MHWYGIDLIGRTIPFQRGNWKLFAMWLVSLAVFGGCHSKSASDGVFREPPVREADVSILMRSQYPAPVSISGDGSQVLLKTVKSFEDELSVVELQSGSLVSRILLKDSPLGLSWSSSNKQIAYFASEGNGSKYQLFVWDLSGGIVKQIDSPATHTAIQPPRWSPNDSQLAYLVGNNEESELWTVDVQHQFLPRKVLSQVSTKGGFEWSPNSRELAAVLTMKPATIRIATTGIPVTGRTIQIGSSITSEVRDLTWSSWSTRLAFAARDTGNVFNLELLDLSTSKIVVCESGSGDVGSPHFQPYSGTLVYSISQSGESTLHATSCDKSPSRLLGFSSGTTRVLKPLLTSAVSHEIAVLHSSLAAPPALYSVPVGGGPVRTLYRAPGSSALESKVPKLVNVSGLDGNLIPTIHWPRTSSTRSNVVVVEVHGGPHLHASLKWEFLPMLLNARGIDVLSPNYRGSSGFGLRHEREGDIRLRTRDVVSVCNYAKTLNNGRSSVILVGTSYGAYLAASAAVADPDEVAGLVLLSMVDEKSDSLPFRGPGFPVVFFIGENDSLSPTEGKRIVESFFRDGILTDTGDLWRAVEHEGHVFRHGDSLEEIYSTILRMASNVSETHVNEHALAN